MPRYQNGGPNGHGKAPLGKQAAKRKVIEQISLGRTVQQAMESTGRTSTKTYELWRREDPDFREEVDMARTLMKRQGGDTQSKRQAAIDMGFAAFREKYLNRETPWHQQQWIDIIEGREPRDLHPAQTWESVNRQRVIINCPPEFAKALALDTPLPTPTGWTTMGDVRVGDLVLGADGLPTEVTTKSQVWNKRTYRITFSGGDQIVACEDHLWQVKSRWSRNETDVVTTAHIAKGWLEGADKRPVYRVPVPEPIKLPEAELLVEPYVLGAWLGDGSTDGAVFTVSDEDLGHLYTKLAASEHVSGVHQDRTAVRVTVRNLRTRLRAIGVLGSKHIPANYLRASIDQRFELLQGLIDTDGTIQQNGMASFCNTNHVLTDGVVELVRSLGMKCRVYEGRAMLDGKDCGPYWRVFFQPGLRPVCSLPRKAAQQKPANVRGLCHTITNVEEIDTVPTQCISVDNADHLYIAGGGWIVTHNTTTISTDYAVYLICTNPDIRIAIISATERMSKRIVYGIKLRLTQPQYKDLIQDFAPEGGFQAAADSWTTTEIYIGGERQSSEKDPTLQALGVGSQIYGARLDLIIVDDGTDLKHAGEYEKQFNYIAQECDSRLGVAGMMLIVGTRVATVDLYSELANPENYPLGISPWSWLTQPAILEEASTPADWVTLWPRAGEPWGPHDGCGCDDCEVADENGLYRHWDGQHLQLVRSRKPPRLWSLVYQQSSLDDDMTFPMYAINESIDASRRLGTMNSRHSGDLSQMHFIAGLDPATSGQAGAVVLAVDGRSGKRFVVDAAVLFGPTPRQLKDLMKEWSTKYPLSEWVVDKTGLNTYFVQDDELLTWLASRGIRLVPHYISSNKWDPTFGIASIANLFGTWQRREGKPVKVSDPIISLPRLESDGIKALIHQLQVWTPDSDPKRVPQDVLMALWFAEIQGREVVKKADSKSGRFRKSKFYSARDVNRRGVINMADYRGAVGM